MRPAEHVLDIWKRGHLFNRRDLTVHFGMNREKQRDGVTGTKIFSSMGCLGNSAALNEAETMAHTCAIVLKECHARRNNCLWGVAK